MKTFLQYFVIFVVSICLFSASSFVLGNGVERDSIFLIVVGIVMIATSFVAWIILLNEVFDLHF